MFKIWNHLLKEVRDEISSWRCGGKKQPNLKINQCRKVTLPFQRTQLTKKVPKSDLGCQLGWGGYLKVFWKVIKSFEKLTKVGTQITLFKWTLIFYLMGKIDWQNQVCLPVRCNHFNWFLTHLIRKFYLQTILANLTQFQNNVFKLIFLTLLPAHYFQNRPSMFQQWWKPDPWCYHIFFTFFVLHSQSSTILHFSLCVHRSLSKTILCAKFDE